MTYASARMRGNPLCAQLTMLPDECERSPLALGGYADVSGKVPALDFTCLLPVLDVERRPSC